MQLFLDNDAAINIKGRLYDFGSPIIMGILNVSPNSFFSQHLDSFAKMISHSEKMISEGATILDIGGMTTKPGSDQISEKEEWERVGPVIKELRRNFPNVLLSVDTYRGIIAEKSADEGIDMVNDISAGELNNSMLPTMGKLKLPYIAMHMQGRPRTMQQQPQYENVVQDILSYFIRKIEECDRYGIKDLLIDPGFGFGKTIDQNYELLNGMHQFQILEKTILVGLSRKSMIYKSLDITPEQALNGTTALHMIALQQGAKILRVHDVKEAKECIKLWSLLRK